MSRSVRAGVYSPACRSRVSRAGVNSENESCVMADRPSPLLWVLFLAYFTFGMITNVLGVVIPEVIKEYQLSLFAAGILAFAFYRKSVV